MRSGANDTLLPRRVALRALRHWRDSRRRARRLPIRYRPDSSAPILKNAPERAVRARSDRGDQLPCVNTELASDVSNLRRARRCPDEQRVSMRDFRPRGMVGSRGTLGCLGEQVVSPCGEPVPQAGDVLGADAVLGERSVGDLAERPESVGKHEPVEAVVRCCREFEQVFAGVPATGEDRVDIEERERPLRPGVPSRARCLRMAHVSRLPQLASPAPRQTQPQAKPGIPGPAVRRRLCTAAC